MQIVKLNIIPGSVLPVVNVSQYDAHRQFSLQVYDGASTYDLTGKTVEIRGTKPDGNGFAYDQTDGVVSVSGNTVTISTKEQMTAVGGHVMAELHITSGQTILGTLNFIIDVEPSALSDDTPISGTEIPAIERQLEEIVESLEVSAEDAEAWAVGERDGEPVPSSDPTYHNNAKYYASNALSSASTATTKAGEAATSATNAGNSATTASNAATTATTKAGEASTSATNAGNSATAAAADSLEAEGWAVGEQGGTPVGPTSPYYQNNAAYYAAQAGQYATGGLIFKGSVAFANIPTTGMVNGDMYNITDDFTTDSRFIEGAGVAVKAGADIAFVAGSVNKWDILALGGGGGADALDDLTDVELTSPAEGDLLQYDATEQKWVNSAKIPQKVAGLQKTGCVNRLKCTATSQVLQGVTCTVNDDKSVTLSGGPAQEAFDFHYSLEGSGGGLSDIGTYRLVGCPVGGGSKTYRIFAYIYAGSTYVTTIGDVGKGAPLTLASGQRCPVINIVVSAGADFTNPVTIKPMITDDLSATYADYQPYAMTNRELTEAVTVEELQTISSTIHCFKQGGVGIISGYISIPESSLTVGASYSVGTLDVGLRPKYEAIVVAACNHWSDGVTHVYKPASVTIKQNGSLSIVPAELSGVYSSLEFYFSNVYVLA